MAATDGCEASVSAWGLSASWEFILPETAMLMEMNKSIAILFAALFAVTASAQKHPKAPRSLRLYVFDCGTIHTTNGDAYSLKKEEMGSTEMSIPCFMIVHPKGTLMWDNGDIPDGAFKP